MRFVITALCLTLCLGLAFPAQAFFGLFDSHAKLKVEGPELSIDVSRLKAGEAKFYRIEQDGLVIRFFLARDRNEVMHAALDACDVCWKEGQGYKLEDGVMVCSFCQMKFPLPRIGAAKGGCNPHPLTFTEQDRNLILNVDELLSGAHYFPENQQ